MRSALLVCCGRPLVPGPTAVAVALMVVEVTVAVAVALLVAKVARVVAVGLMVDVTLPATVEWAVGVGLPVGLLVVVGLVVGLLLAVAVRELVPGWAEPGGQGTPGGQARQASLEVAPEAGQ